MVPFDQITRGPANGPAGTVPIRITGVQEPLLSSLNSQIFILAPNLQADSAGHGGGPLPVLPLAQGLSLDNRRMTVCIEQAHAMGINLEDIGPAAGSTTGSTAGPWPTAAPKAAPKAAP